MKKTKLKVKKQVWYFLIILIFLTIGIFAYKKIHADILYKKTDEYKLLNVGYTKEDIKLLKDNTNEDTIKSLIESPKNEFLLALIKEKYYLNKYLNRYLEYNKNNPKETASEVIALVNVNRDYNYYDQTNITDTSLDELMLVNKYNSLPNDYEPNDLINVSNKYYYGENHKLAKKAYDAFIDMWNEAKEEDIYLIMNSSYRSLDSQIKVYDSYKNKNGTTYADSIAARPGYSEHQTGLALDLFSKANTTTTNFKGSPAHIWLQNNSYKFGFIERYPEDKENITGFTAEAWHYRYVGIEAATYIHDNNITFDEYYAYFIEK